VAGMIKRAALPPIGIGLPGVAIFED